MLFTNFLKAKGKENQSDSITNSQSVDPAASGVLKPTVSGLVNNVNILLNPYEPIQKDERLPESIPVAKTPIILRDPLAIVDSRKQNLSSVNATTKTPLHTINNAKRVRTEYYNDEEEDPNPLHRIE